MPLNWNLDRHAKKQAQCFREVLVESEMLFDDAGLLPPPPLGLFDTQLRPLQEVIARTPAQSSL